MIIGERLRLLREYRNLSQGDVERRTGLLRCYISRVENGHTVPSVETLEKIARGLDLPLYAVLYEDSETLGRPRNRINDNGWGSSGKAARFLGKLRRYLPRMNERDKAILMSTVSQMAARSDRPPKKP
jgi:transcriptional regulator with XRE-family HTH domain